MIVFPSGIVSERVGCEGGEQALPSLVLTGHESLRRRLRLIAEARGCVCRAPVTVAAAWRDLGADPRLAFIDIAHPLDGRSDETRAIAETLAARRGPMLVVCGGPPPVMHEVFGGADEIWARALGAFVYLPGVGTDAGIAVVVDEALRLSSQPA